MAANKKFEILPDGFGVRMHVKGKTVRELFRNALLGVTSYMSPDAVPTGRAYRQAGRQAEARAKNDQQEHEEIAIDTVDINSLLVDFLSRVVARSDMRNAVFTGITFKKFGENFLSGQLTGVATDRFENEIRAISYADVDIRKNPKTGLYETMLTLEV